MLWTSAVTAGFYDLLLYDTAPGEVMPPPSAWPAEREMPTTAGLFKLVLVVHPQCACSRASIGELAILMAKFQDKVDAYALFHAPSSRELEWSKTDLWDTAISIPGLKAVIDKDGVIAKRFNALTSGEALLYDPDGKLLFWGGITSSRGHSGDNLGRDTITKLLSGVQSEVQQTAVFGCHMTKKLAAAKGES